MTIQTKSEILEQGSENAEIIGNTPLHFHIGRGGRFNNGGHVIFKCIRSIYDTSAYESLFLKVDEDEEPVLDEYGNKIYLKGNGEEAETYGLSDDDDFGSINMDDEYDTTYVTALKSLTSIREFDAIFENDHWTMREVQDLLYEYYEIDPESEDAKEELISAIGL